MSKLSEVLDNYVFQCSPEAGAALLAAITEADAEIARLTRERDEARAELEAMFISRERWMNSCIEARANALDEAAELAENYGATETAEAIFALKGDKP